MPANFSSYPAIDLMPIAYAITSYQTPGEPERVPVISFEPEQITGTPIA